MVSSWKELTSNVRKSSSLVCSTTSHNGSPILPAATVLRCECVSTRATSSVVVVFPFVPVIARLRQRAAARPLLPRPITNTFLFATAYILTGPVEENCAKRATRMRSCLYRMEFVRFTANLALQSWWPLLGSVHLGGRPAGGTTQRH